MKRVPIQTGEFLMGSPDSDEWAADHEKPEHRVRITKRFYLGMYLVTQEGCNAIQHLGASYGRRK